MESSYEEEKSNQNYMSSESYDFNSSSSIDVAKSAMSFSRSDLNM